MAVKLSPYDIKRILQGSKSRTMPVDDFQLIDSWTEYEEDGKTSEDERKLKHLCYEIEVKNPETGEVQHLFKAIKLMRVIRVPKGAKQDTSMMDVHAELLSSCYDQGYNLITVIANIVEPVALGLLFLYGVQGTADNIEDAKEDCDRAFFGLVGMLTATYRVLHVRKVVAQETEWLRHKMYNMDYLTMVRGIPEASNEGENVGNKGFGGTAVNPGSRGTLEEIILGMADYEYVIQVISSPVYMKTLKAWSARTQADMTDWNSQLQGTKSISMNISMPMMFMANASQSAGWSHAYTDAESVSFNTGESYTTGVSENIGSGISESLGTSISQSYGQSVSQSLSDSYGRSVGESFSQSQGFSVTDSTSNSYSLSQGSSLSQNVSFSDGFNTSNGTSFNEGTNESQSSGTNEGFGTSTSTGTNTGVNQGVSTSTGQSVGQSFGSNQSFSEGQSLGVSQSSGWNQGVGQSVTDSVSQGASVSQNVGVNDSVSQSIGQNIGGSSSNSWGHSIGTSTGESAGDSWGSQEGWSNGVNVGVGSNNSQSSGASANQGSGGNAGFDALGASVGSSENSGFGANSGESKGDSGSIGISNGRSGGTSVGNNIGSSTGTSNTSTVSGSNSQSWGQSIGQSVSSGMSQGWGYTDTVGQSTSVGLSESHGVSGSVGTSQSNSITNSFGVSEGVSNTLSLSNTLNDGWSQGFNLGTGTSRNMGTSMSDTLGSSLSHGISESVGTSKTMSHGDGVSQSNTVSQGNTFGRSVGQSVNFGHTQSITESRTQSITNGVSQSITDGTSQSITNGISQNIGKGTSQSLGQTSGQGVSRSESESLGSTGAIATGLGGSMGFGPSIGYNKSYQWLDQTVKDILELLEFQNERLKQALRGGGAFYTYVYIATETKDGLSTAMALAKSAWHSQSALSNPIQVLNLSEEEQHHLLNHFSAFSADITREMVGGISEYKYSTVLLNTEYVAYNHLPRVSEGGVFAEVEDIPKFSTPSMLKGEIYMGNILSAERFTFENGYLTPYEYRIAEEELMHGFFTGASGSGKTVAALRFMAELSRVRRKRTGKRLRIVCMDPKSDWRALARYIEPERFKFLHMANPDFHPISFNPCKIPYGVRAQHWVDVLIEIFCRSYGLLERGKQLMAETFYDLYSKAGVFDAQDQPDWKEKIPELSRQVTFAKAYEKMKAIKKEMDDGTGSKGKGGHDTADAYSRLLERLSAFERPYSIEHRLYGSSDGMSVDDLIGADDVTVLESKGLESTFKNFIFGVITSGFYRYAIAQEGGYMAEDQYETVLMIEEANEVLIGNDTAAGGQQVSLSGQSEFEQILDQARGYGLYIFAVTQKISEMPKSVIANSGLKFAGRVEIEDDANVISQSMARDPRFDNRDIRRLFPRLPIGWFVCRSSKTESILDAEPVLTKIAMLNVSTPTDKELDELLMRNVAMKQLKENSHLKPEVCVA
jgi:hypothetical protein